ncbi:MAG: hypothetical protein P1P90_01035 [Patescibacteria group bacterium]|nr:hypothetical protein [Patescibacteria group bacterium]
MKIEINKFLVGGVLFAVIFIAVGFLAYQYILKQQQPIFVAPVVNPEAGLGAEGALCGGNKRLPCLPGNQCEITNTDTKEGVCVHVTDNPGKAEPPAGNN